MICLKSLIKEGLDIIMKECLYKITPKNTVDYEGKLNNHKDYLMYNDLGFETEFPDFIYKFSDLEVGDNPFSHNNDWEILEIKDNAILIAPSYNPEDIDEWLFYYIKDPNEDKGLYGGKLDLIL